jgi:proteasome lid subunit RPN8/RPN11
MQLKNSNIKQKNIYSKVVELPNKIKVVISEEFQDKVKYLCQHIPKVEWSGVLFYQVIGSIQSPDTMELHCKDIFLMHKGTATYTEYAYSEEVVQYRMDNPESLDWLIGHIHSHNTMPTFFSGTDREELEDNSPNHNFYFSLIVNNFLDMTAKVSFVGEMEISTTGYECRDEKGNIYQLGLPENLKRKVLFTYDCDIQKPYSSINVTPNFTERYRVIEQQAKLREENLMKAAIQREKGKEFSHFPNFNFSAAHFPNKERSLAEALAEGEEEDEIIIEEDSEIEQFLTYILRLGNLIEGDNLDEAIEDMKFSKINESRFINTIIENFPNYFDTFFDEFQHEDVGQKFLDVLGSCIETLQDYQIEYDGLEPLTEALQQLGFKFEHLINQKDGRNIK